jgi:hypothetical protein
LSLAIDDFANPSRFGFPIGEGSIKLLPCRLANPLVCRHPDAMILPNGDHKPQLQLTQGLDKVGAFALQAVSQHHLNVKAPLLKRLNQLNGHLWCCFILIFCLPSCSWLKDLEESRQGDFIQDTIRLDGNHPIVNLAPMAHVLSCHISRGLPFFLVTGFVDAQCQGAAAYDVLHQLESLVAQGRDRPRRSGENMVS